MRRWTPGCGPWLFCIKMRISSYWGDAMALGGRSRLRWPRGPQFPRREEEDRKVLGDAADEQSVSTYSGDGDLPGDHKTRRQVRHWYMQVFGSAASWAGAGRRGLDSEFVRGRLRRQGERGRAGQPDQPDQPGRLALPASEANPRGQASSVKGAYRHFGAGPCCVPSFI